MGNVTLRDGVVVQMIARGGGGRTMRQEAHGHTDGMGQRAYCTCASNASTALRCPPWLDPPMCWSTLHNAQPRAGQDGVRNGWDAFATGPAMICAGTGAT